MTIATRKFGTPQTPWSVSRAILIIDDVLDGDDSLKSTTKRVIYSRPVCHGPLGVTSMSTVKE